MSLTFDFIASVSYEGANYSQSDPLNISDKSLYNTVIANVQAQKVQIYLVQTFLGGNLKYIISLYALYKGPLGGSVTMDTGRGILSDITPFQPQ